ncbi:hypothetical protein JKP88DRAFT_265666 [Tribonema minus]|uniref:Ankyrin repeat protein n=1 Tax=Tribonema minus TaxID=303371 RepID=A0A836C7E5_9STRA|nr:hypothetical protein JKP88DRAFT_265666 [Tribonema minus]
MEKTMEAAQLAVDEAYAYVCARVEAMMRQLAKGGPAAISSPGADAELHGLHAIATQLSALGGRFHGLEPILAGLAAARGCHAEPAAKKSKSCQAQSAAHTALGDRVILGHILQFTSNRSWLFIAGLSPHWRGAYMATCARHCGVARLFRTAWREALFSVDTFAAAADAGLLRKQHQHALRRQLGKWGTRVLLACASGAGFDVALEGSMLVSAAESGRPDWFIHLGRLLVTRGVLSRKNALLAAVTAARCGDGGGMLGWLASLGITEMPDWLVLGLATAAARHGHLHTLRWVVAHARDWGMPVPDDFFDNFAVMSCDMDEGVLFGCFEQLVGSDEFPEYYNLVDTAVRAGHLHIVQYIVGQQVATVSTESVTLAVEMGLVDVAIALQDDWDEHDAVELMTDVLANDRNCPVELFDNIRASSLPYWSAADNLSRLLTTVEAADNVPLAAWLRSLGATTH